MSVFLELEVPGFAKPRREQRRHTFSDGLNIFIVALQHRKEWEARTMLMEKKRGGTSCGGILGISNTLGTIKLLGAEDENHREPDRVKMYSIFDLRISRIDNTLT